MDPNDLLTFNNILSGSQSISDLFDDSSYIRMNMIYVFPYALIGLKQVLGQYNLKQMYASEKGIHFELEGCNFTYSGDLKVVKNGEKIFSIDFDFTLPEVTPENHSILQASEIFMMRSDCFFFMLSEYDFDKEILSNPIHESIDLLSREFRRNEASK